MPKLARAFERPIPLIVLAAALLVGTFSGVAYAATRATAKPVRAANARAAFAKSTSRPTASSPTIVFHPLTLLNGAKSEASLGTGAPQYAVSGGVVYLAGSLSGPSNQSLPAFILPAGARPGYYDCFSIYSDNGYASVQSVGALHIYASGKAYLQGPDTSIFSSLSGVSFVVGY